MDSFFFSKSILLIYFRALNQQSFRVILAICYFGALWACHACLTSPKKKFMIKLQLPWISYYMQKVNLLPEIVFQILKFKKLSYYPIRLVQSIFNYNSGTRFFTAMSFLQILKGGVYHLKQKNHIDGPNLSSKSVLLIFCRALRACLTKPKENYVIKLYLPWTLNNIQERNFIPQIIFVILKLKKSWNLIGREHFRL